MMNKIPHKRFIELMVQARIAHDTGDFATAFPLYQMAIQQEPDNAGYHVLLGDTLVMMGDHKGAIGLYRKALSLDPRLPGVASQLAYELGKDASNRQESTALLKEHLASNPNDGIAWTNLGVNYYQDGRYADAVQAHKEALKSSDIKKSEVWNNLGNDYYKLGDFRNAAEAYKEARGRSHDILWNAFYWGGKAEMQLRDYKTASETFRILTMHALDDIEAFIALADARAESGDLEGAVQAYLDFLAKHPTDDIAWNNVSCFYVRAGKPDRAIECARKALAIESKNDTNWTTLGEALEAAGDVSGAIDAYRKARAINPGEKDAAAHLERLNHR